MKRSTADCLKVVKVILSCTNKLQLLTAQKMVTNFRIMYPTEDMLNTDLRNILYQMFNVLNSKDGEFYE